MPLVHQTCSSWKVVTELPLPYLTIRLAKMKRSKNSNFYLNRLFRCLIPRIFSFISLSSLLLFCGCQPKTEKKRFVIGFSQCTGADNWRKATLEGLEKEMSFHPGSTLVYRNAKDNSNLQIQHIRELLKMNIDILLVSPNEAEPLTPIIEEVYKKGIPVVVIDRRTSSEQYTSFVGVDNFEIGRMAGTYIANHYNGDSLHVVEILGLPGSTPAGERERGFKAGIQSNPGIQLRQRVYGNWLMDKAAEELSAVQGALKSNDIVFAQNDPMALGAYEVYKKKGWQNSARFIGVDGLSGPGGGIALVSDKILEATLYNPPGGEEALQIGFKILKGEPYQKENLLQTVVIDSTNVRIMKLQTDKMRSQQKDIERQQAVLGEQLRQYDSQRNIVYLLITILIISTTLGAVILLALKANRRINRSLKEKNAAILKSEQELILMSEKAQAANDAKLQFFTNISHEFRTPLTLILAPLEDSMDDKKSTSKLNSNLDLVHRNVIRLLRMVNQLMDFRKIEFGKLRLRATENDFIAFVKEIMESFRPLAEKNDVDFQLIVNTRDVKLWFDTNMIDKVLFNLLANAFKFTGEHGFIHVIIDQGQENGVISLKVHDSGIGMSSDAVEHVFEQFYQGDFENFKGTGLGLALSKELIQLHQGEINVASEKGKGTCFTLSLKTGHAHLQDADRYDPGPNKQVTYEDERIYLTELEPQKKHDSSSTLKSVKEYSILIIEDNTDLRQFLASKLGGEYEIYSAEGSKQAIEFALNEVPDLIICDLVIPGQTGTELTHIFKSDVRTSHIPVILLTAKTKIEDQIDGMRSQADVYITKPFNLQLLQQTIKSLLANRAKLREHYSSGLQNSLKTQLSKLDRKFVVEFKAYIEHNLSNEGLTVEDICKAMCVSKVQLYRKVKALLDYNVNDYLLNCRMQKAKYYLQHEELTIGEIAEKVGFASAAYFSTVFKSKMGVTPTAFKINQV